MVDGQAGPCTGQYMSGGGGGCDVLVGVWCVGGGGGNACVYVKGKGSGERDINRFEIHIKVQVTNRIIWD